ncbi:MAG: molybdenum cofactor guanylyltransferase [Ignavibacteriae bacterium]|nr:molybdenum cofactor guanylyltransferase [Ignavibacteriota bacterium]
MHSDISGIILSGGASSRIGSDKAMLEVGSKKIVEIIKDTLQGIFKKVMIITNNPVQYNFLDLEMHEDIYKNIGPIGGIHSGLVNSGTEKNFFISCDMPFVNKNLIEFIITNSDFNKITVTKTKDGLQPLCGLFPGACICIIDELVSASKFSIHGIFDVFDTKIIDIENEFTGFSKKLFFNINTVKDYEEIKNLI